MIWKPYGLDMLLATLLIKYRALQRIKDFHRRSLIQLDTPLQACVQC